MTDQMDVLLQIAQGKSKVQILTGTFVSATASALQVDVGGGRIPAQSLTNYLPEINENIYVMFVDGKPFVTGPTATIADRGTVVSVAGGLVTLTTDFGDVTCPYGGSSAPSAGQVWKLIKHGGYYADSLMSTSPPPNIAPAGPGGGVKARTNYFTALDAGSYRPSDGWWTGQVRAGDTNQGAWFYGSKIADSIPSSAVIGTVAIYVAPIRIQGDAPNFALHGYQSKPGGAPSYGSQTAIGIAGGWVGLPSAWGNSLKRGGGSFGVGLNHGGNNLLKSLAQDGFSGRLRITSVY